MTLLDGYWGAKIVMSFTNEQLRAAVEQGNYSDPEAVDYLIRILKERRDKIGNYYFSRVNPLDKFKIQIDANNKKYLHFIDLAIESGLESTDKTKYRFDLHRNGSLLVSSFDIDNNTNIPLPVDPSIQAENKESFVPAPGTIEWEYTIRTLRSSNGEWSKWVKVYIISDKMLNSFKLLGIKRES